MPSIDPVGAFQQARGNALAQRAAEQNLSRAPQRNQLQDIQIQKGQQDVNRERQASGFRNILSQQSVDKGALDIQAGQQAQSDRTAIALGNAAKLLSNLPKGPERDKAWLQLEPVLDKNYGVPAGSITREEYQDDSVLTQFSNISAIGQQAKQNTGFQKGATALVQTDTGPAFATSVLNPATGETKTSLAPINAKLVSKLGETGQEETVRKIDQAAKTADAKGISTRNQEQITNGIAAADSTAGIRRGIQLLEAIETGGIDKIQVASKQFFGVESGDEGELSNLLGKAVLSQLRATFGAAFTAKEGESLKGIEANMGRSPASNKRLLSNALRLAERAAKRGIARAVESEDFRTAADIQESLDFTLGELPQNKGEGEVMVDANGNKARVFADGTFEEVQ